MRKAFFMNNSIWIENKRFNDVFFPSSPVGWIPPCHCLLRWSFNKGILLEICIIFVFVEVIMRFGPGLFTTLLGSRPEVSFARISRFWKIHVGALFNLSGFLFSRDGLLATKQFVESSECFGEVDKCFVCERISSLLKAAFSMECFWNNLSVILSWRRIAICV